MKQLLFVTFFFCSLCLSAQDVIVKRDGSTILSKVLEVNKTDIKYKKFSNLNGPTYTIEISEIMSINYKNGEKEDYNISSNATEQKTSRNSGPSLVKKPADANNRRIIQQHNVVHPNFDGKSPSNSKISSCVIKFGVKSTSIMSNDDIEMEFVRKVATGYDYDDELCYFINIKNKTDKILYVDRGNCFKIYNDGYSYCYFDASKQTTVNNGGSSGGSVNLGSLAGALGIGGTIGQIAGGVEVGGSNSSSISTTYASQRIIAIPPHGSKFLTEYIWVGAGNRRTCVEEPEDFKFLLYLSNNHEFKSTHEIGLRRGDITKHGTKVLGENDLRWKREYYITYSTDADFSTYSALHAELYIQELIGNELYLSDYLKLHKKGKWFLNKNTIIGHLSIDK